MHSESHGGSSGGPELRRKRRASAASCEQQRGGGSTPDVDALDGATTVDSGASSSRRCATTREDMQAFFRLLGRKYLQAFLEADAHKQHSDKYLLAMVFVYFKRAKLRLREYTIINFFAALHLANDVEEDEEDYQKVILKWALNYRKHVTRLEFYKLRDDIWRRMDHKAIVSLSSCEEVMETNREHSAWARSRVEIIRNESSLEEEVAPPPAKRAARRVAGAKACARISGPRGDAP